MVTITPQLGIGIYTPAEAAYYARVTTKLMSRWVFGSCDGKSVIERQLPDSEEKVVTFLDFVQALAVREVRNRYGLSLQRIRQGVEEARTQYDLQYPLAHRHRIFLYSDGRRDGHGEMVIRVDGLEGEEGEEQRYVQLTGPNKGNRMLKQVVEPFLEDLTFDGRNGLASQYRPLRNGQYAILLDPLRRFGEPLVEPSGYTAATLWNATNNEGGIDEAAEAYGVSREEVVIANRYFDGLDSRTS